MTECKTEREAKEYLAGRIVEEARREGTPLSEVEREMLYFTESGWTLPDMMVVNEEFERDYDEGEYEQKIGELVAKIQARDAAESEQDQTKWDNAVAKLGDGDHYLLVLINTAPVSGSEGSPRWKALEPWLPSWDRRARNDPKDRWRLMVVGLMITAVLILGLFLSVMFRH